MSLWSDFLNSDKRPIHKWKHYFPAYEKHFARFVNTDVVFMEIGCGKGGSSQMWKRYFGPHARIIGIDIRPACKAYEDDQVSVRIGDQSDLAFLDEVCAEFGMPDIILDDGSHVMKHIEATFSHLYPRMPKHGVYMVEDLHTAYWPNYGGGLNEPGSFIEKCKHLIDCLNADHTRGALAPDDFTRTTLSMHFYDSIVAFERGRHTPKKAPVIGAPRKHARRRA